MKTYYHATPFENLESILKDQEVHKGCDGVVYLAKKPEDAVKFLAIRGCKKILVFGFMLDEEKVSESFDHSEAFFKCKAYMYPDNISFVHFVSAQTFEI
jgi:hypothetical protein